jgi:hypothetical protein
MEDMVFKIPNPPEQTLPPNPLGQGSPSIFDQFSSSIFDQSDGMRLPDLTAWFTEHYPGHIQEAVTKATVIVGDSITEPNPSHMKFTLPIRVPDDAIHKVRPNHDESKYDVEDLVLGRNPPVDNGETWFGDYQQSPMEANAIGPGGFWFEIDHVLINWGEDGFYAWSARLMVLDSLGVSTGDPPIVHLLLAAQARFDYDVVRGTWMIYGFGQLTESGNLISGDIEAPLKD